MKTASFYSELSWLAKRRKDVVIKKYKLNYKNGRYDFIKISSKKITPQDKVILIRAGIHGNETAGPLTVLRHFNEIIDYIHKNGLKIILYPLGNPSGFETNQRYNIDNDKGSAGNNDFLRYELKNGEVIDDLGKNTRFNTSIKSSIKNWYWSSDKKLKIKLPKETRLTHKLLKKDPLSQVAAVIDLHQDYITKNAPPAAYHYAFGNLEIYKNVVQKIKRLLPILKNKHIAAGFDNGPMKSDANGFIVRHDGSLPDLMYRLGTKHCVTVETTGATSPDLACQVNLIWIFGVADLSKLC